MKHLLQILLVVICCSLVASTALAERTITATRIGDADITVLNSQAKGDCLVGNLEAPAWALSGWVTGGEIYKYYFNPRDEGCCALGFQMEAVHILLQFSADTHPLPQTFNIFADLQEGLWDPAIGCWTPGETLCEGDVYTITIEAEGMYDIAIPLTGCECAYVEYDYFMGIGILDALDCALIVDNTPTPCLAWNYWGSTWEDLYNWGFDAYGDLVMYADVICCDDPVSKDASTWSDVKSLFR